MAAKPTDRARGRRAPRRRRPGARLRGRDTACTNFAQICTPESKVRPTMPRSSMAVFSALWRAYGEGASTGRSTSSTPIASSRSPTAARTAATTASATTWRSTRRDWRTRHDHLRRRPRGRARDHRRRSAAWRRRRPDGRDGVRAAAGVCRRVPRRPVRPRLGVRRARPRARPRPHRRRGAHRGRARGRRARGERSLGVRRRAPAGPRLALVEQGAGERDRLLGRRDLARRSAPRRSPRAARRAAGRARCPSSRASSSPRTSGAASASARRGERDGEHVAGELDVAGDRRVGLAPARRQPVGDRQQRHVDRRPARCRAGSGRSSRRSSGRLVDEEAEVAGGGA